MRTYESFFLGAITGAAVVWFWGKEITGSVRARTRGMRTKAAEDIRVVEEGTGEVLDRGGEVLRHAEDVLQDTKERVREALHNAQDAIRPAPTTGGA